LSDQSMSDHKKAYQLEADLYHQLVMSEDHQDNLAKAIDSLLAGRVWDVLELGAGTGRLTAMLTPHAGRVTALDLAPAMLIQARDYLSGQAVSPIPVLAAADHRALPVASQSANLIASGWSVCHLATWNPENWRVELERGMDEIYRALKPGGMVLLVETQGTGREQPDPPEHMLPYLGYLHQAGFNFSWVRTDYRFESQQEAETLTRFFFGEEMVNQIKPGSEVILPECTGIFWKHRP
jgi:ubiquinone/menaquinone biosynthesis C-methylase UbiE